jgi:purine-nucleoside phosphorylase
MTISEERMRDVRDAARVLAELAGPETPVAFIVLGSGLGPAGDAVEEARSLPFSSLPGYAGSTVVGHDGRFVAGRVAGKPVLISRGRIHLYEGHAPHTVALPQRAAATMGIPVMIATNAVGGVDPGLAIGDVVLVTDHLNLQGTSPLEGPNLDGLGPRFPGMGAAYDAGLGESALAAAADAGIRLRPGVLAALRGPAYETPAEVRMLRTLGADVVGMSTVPEVTAAVHAGMRVAVLSLVTNAAGGAGLAHDDVIAAAERGSEAVSAIVEGILSRL